MAKSNVRGGRHRTVPALRSLFPFILPLVVTVALAIIVLPKQSTGRSEKSEANVAMAEPFASGGLQTPNVPVQEQAAITSELAAFKTPLPTPTPRQIRRPATAVPSPTATPRFLPEQYVDNGNFERGLDSWYVEPGAEITGTLVRRGVGAMRISTSGGFASNRFPVIPGTAYRLSAWGMLSASGDAGQVGIEYFDAYGQSLGKYQQPLIFTKPEFVRLALTFTPVSGAATVELSIWKPSGPAVFVVDDISIRAFIDDPGAEES